MGNAPSRSPEIISNDVISSLSPDGQERLKLMTYPNFFEFAFAEIDRDNSKNKSSSSNGSNISQETQTTQVSQKSTSFKVDRVQCEYEYLNGRPYIISNHGCFFLPCDDTESDRTVILHFLIKYAFNGNFVSPVIQSLRMSHKNDRPKVLDIGCGPGTWILEMGTEYPNADFYGIDLRTMFPSTIKPSNTHFIKCNFLESLPFDDNTFVFIRMRLMLSFVTHSEFLNLLSEIYRTLKPNGYFEILDCEYRIFRPGPLCDNLFNNLLKGAFFECGIDTLSMQQLSTLLMIRPKNKGFVNIHQHSVSIPIGWGGQMGDIHLQNFSAFLKGTHPRILHNLSPNDKSLVYTLIDKAISECPEFKSHLNWFVCYCQKPDDPALAIGSINESEMTIPITADFSTEKVSSSYESEHYFNTLESISDFSDGFID